MNDLRLKAPAAARNRDPILAVLRDVLPAQGHVLELASGTGEHIVHFAKALPDLIWQPSDPDERSRASISAWLKAEGPANVCAPMAIDATADTWAIDQADAIICINMIHISPWTATEGLMAGAEKLLPPNGVVYLYGPYRQSDVPTAPSNEAFDADLKARNPDWGLRDLDKVTELARAHSLTLDRVVPMPANNLSVVFRKN